MPPLSKHQSANTTKLLFIGDSGSGKTGALASLASEGYNLRILDLDNGLDVLKNLLTDPASPYKKGSADRVHFVTVTEPMRSIGGKLVPAKADMWQRAILLLDNWKDEETNFGPITSWGPQEVLVIDSLSMLSNAAMNFILALNGRLGQNPYQSDWGPAQQLVEGLLMKLYDTSVKCNVIVNCHITYIGEEGGPLRGYPNTLGKALPPKVGRYFNSALMARTVGSGTTLKRKILTNTAGIVELKNTAPLRVQPEYPLGTGLADYFKAVRSAGAANA